MTEPAVTYGSEDGVGTLTLNRPDNRNAMSPELLDAFTSALAKARSDPGLRCLIITGRGRCFCAGADLQGALQREAGGQTPHERSFAMYTPFLGLLDVEVPVIGALSGHAVGGGFGLALLCDVRIASRSAKYGANFARLGISAGLGISYLLPRLVGVSRAAELLFTGRLFTGEEAEAMGLVSQALDPEEVGPAALRLARTIAANAPLAVRALKRTLYRGLDWDVRGAAFEEARLQATTVTTEDAVEGVRALLDKREPHFRGR